MWKLFLKKARINVAVVTVIIQYLLYTMRVNFIGALASAVYLSTLLLESRYLKFKAKIWQTELSSEGLYTKISLLHCQNSENLVKTSRACTNS